MSTTASAPEPQPEDVQAMLAGVERHLAEVTPTDSALLPAPADDVAQVDAEADDEPEPVNEGGELEPYQVILPVVETRRIRDLQDEVAEAHQLYQLQADPTPLMVDTPKVRRRRKAAAEAARLHALNQDPVTLAYRDQKVRRLVTVMVMIAAVIALAASSIGVQGSVAEALKLREYTLPWWAAFGVEPALSLPLLATVAVQAYSAMRGQVVDRESPAGKKLFRTELLLLGLTLVLNCWPAVVGPEGFDFDALKLIVHALGPVAAVTAVWVLPTLWQVLSTLPTTTVHPPSVDLAGAGAYRGGTGPEYRENAPVQYTPRPPRLVDVSALAQIVRDKIEAGELAPEPGIHAIRKALSVGTDTARLVKKHLTGGAS